MNAEGVQCVLTVKDITGDNIWGPIMHTEPLLAESSILCVGQVVALVVAETEAQALSASKLVEVHIDPLEPVIGVKAGIEAGHILYGPHLIERGDVDGAFAKAALVVDSEVGSPGQDHFYLETQAAMVIPEEDGTYLVHSSTQHPTEIQKVVAATLGISENRVVCKVPRLGGGFGGKESQASPFAAYAALAASVTNRPCKSWLHRHQDMSLTGNRHPFWSRYKAAFDAEGMITALEVELYSDGGWSLDLSGPVMDRALFHVDNSYFLPSVRATGRVVRTNTPSNTAFRGFGGPQGVVVIEDAINRAAESMGLDPTVLRIKNLYGEAPRDHAHYGQEIEENRLPVLVPELLSNSAYDARKKAIDAFNARSTHIKKGLGFQPVKFGISFTASLLNQAGALVHVYTDGSVQVNHGGTEMGQGLHTKMMAVAADVFGVDLKSVRLMTTATDKVPNTSATAASSGSDLNGAAVAAACMTVRDRLLPVARQLLSVADDIPLRFESSEVHGNGQSVSFAQVAKTAWASQISLSSTGYYATPGIEYDASVGQGRPFFYYAFGGAVSEVEVNGLTGEYKVSRVDILHDVGHPLAPDIDVGQVEGGFVQGMGWLTCEEVLYNAEGRLLTPGPSTYKIPAAGDVPDDFTVNLLANAPNNRVIGGSKAVGEPPFLLAISVVTALRHAITAYSVEALPVELTLPATPESVLRGIAHQKGEPTS
jgi:xanthine dehydrogenase large subunit